MVVDLYQITGGRFSVRQRERDQERRGKGWREKREKER